MTSNEKIPVWLEKYIEAKRFSEDVERFRRVSIIEVEEFISSLRTVYWNAGRGRRSPRSRELARLEQVYRRVYEYLRVLASLPSTRFMSSFHRELVESIIGERYNRALARIRRARDRIRRFYLDYRLLILSSSNAKEAARLRREGLGRILSVFRELEEDIEIVQRVRKEILGTHIISEGLPVVIVAGIPNTGKSTLVRRLSSAKPEIAPYPFTTKNIVVGKTVHKGTPFYLVDTPGLLDSPIEEKNVIEKKAVVALRTVADLVLFMVDPTDDSVVQFESQVRLFKDVKTINKGVNTLVVFNKIDAVDREKLERMMAEFSRGANVDVNSIVTISALYGTNVDTLLDRIVSEIYSSIVRKWSSKRVEASM